MATLHLQGPGMTQGHRIGTPIEDNARGVAVGQPTEEDRVVVREGHPLQALLDAPLSPETVERIERMERASASAGARAGDILLD